MIMDKDHEGLNKKGCANSSLCNAECAAFYDSMYYFEQCPENNCREVVGDEMAVNLSK